MRLGEATGTARAIPAERRRELESQFGYDFASIRVVDDPALGDIGARAAAGRGQIRFRDATAARDARLWRHEAAHLVQQAQGEVPATRTAARDQDLEGRASRAGAGSGLGSLRRPALPPQPVIQFSFESDALAELHRMPSAEVPDLEPAEERRRLIAISERRARLRVLFGGVMQADASGYLERLRSRRRGDVLSERFHDMLHHAERRELLGILERIGATTPAPVASGGPTVADVLRLSETIPTNGLPRDQANYADRAFQGIASAPIGDFYTLFRTYANGQGTGGISVPKTEFHLDADPLTGFVVTHNRVYRTRQVAEEVLAAMAQNSPGAGTVFVTYYLRDGVIFPTTLSTSTLPILTDNLRRKRAQDQADVAATAELARQVMWWYVGARLGMRPMTAGGAPPGGPPGGGRLPPIPGGTAGPAAAAGGATAAFRAAAVAEELFTSTASITNNGQRMIAAIRQLAGMSLTAAQKAEVTLEFFRRIGFATSTAGLVDEGASLIMYSEDSRFAFRYIKATAEILYGRFDVAARDYIWRVLQ